MLVFQEDDYRKIIKANEKDLSNLKKKFKKSKTSFYFESSTGIFHGTFQDTDFKGHFIIEHKSAGFMKGFSYTVNLDFINYIPNLTDDGDLEDYLNNIRNCKKIIIEPDQLNETNFVKMILEDQNGNDLQDFYYLPKH